AESRSSRRAVRSIAARSRAGARLAGADRRRSRRRPRGDYAPGGGVDPSPIAGLRPGPDGAYPPSVARLARPRRPGTRALGSALAIALLGAAGAAEADIYRWTDAAG